MSDGNPAKDAWNAATELLRADGSLSDSQAAFVRMAHPLAWVEDIFMIAVGSEFVKTWIEEHVSETMTSMLSNILGRPVRIVISVDPSVNESQPVGPVASAIASNPPSSSEPPYSASPASMGSNQRGSGQASSMGSGPMNSRSSSSGQASSGPVGSSHTGSGSTSSDQMGSGSTGSGSMRSDSSNLSSPAQGSSTSSAATREISEETSENPLSVASDESSNRYPETDHYSETSRRYSETPAYEEASRYERRSAGAGTDYARTRRRHLDTSPSTEDSALSHMPSESFTQGMRYVDQTTIAEEVLAKRPDTAARSQKARINPRYTFDNFVIGDNNRFATATSLAVAESPGTTYNPLFLYSDSGMGKTHLMHAIGNYALNLFPSIKVRYVSAEEFTNAFINSVRDGHQAEFKNQFRTVDILLIDDIQFIGGRDSTVEEFFHTFNALTNSNKQIVITSDVSPNLLNGFEERMLSRFNSGVTANIDRPNLETRIAILEKKAHSDGFTVPREVNEYIATHMLTNVREMEGALRRVTAFADLSKQTINLSLAEMILKDLIANPDAIEITATLIMSQTAGYFDISIEEMISTDRSRVLVSARQVAMYLCREMTELSLPKIGHLFGKRDHTTVMHACRKIDKQMAERQTTYNQVSELTSRIKQAAQQASL
jgi:chromosomal replication initiator protein DnaA